MNAPQIHTKSVGQLNALQQEMLETIMLANGPLLARLEKLEKQLERALTNPDDTFVTVEQAAKIMKVHPRTVRRHCHDGRIEFRRDGRKILIDRQLLLQIAA